MGPDGWITIGVLGLVLVSLIRSWAPPDAVFLGSAVLLTLFGVLKPAEAFCGFSNTGVLTLAALFVVAAALRETGVLDYLGFKVLGGVKKEGTALVRLGGIVLPMSAFLNNTPIVAMLMPVTMDWCRKRNISPSKLLMPLSYFCHPWGMCTLIGTSTNLVIHGLILETVDNLPPGTETHFREGLSGMGIFEIGKVGLPFALIGTAYLLLLEKN